MVTHRILLPLFQDNCLAHIQGDLAEFELHTYPDGESLIRIHTPVKDTEVVIICSLNEPNLKIIPLIFAAQTARDLGANTVGLIAPYLSYMRQDKIFHPGEGLTSKYFASVISAHFDWLQTVDPHLHRWHDLNQIYSIPAQTLHATRPVADWIKAEVKNPVLIGPDAESKQSVSEVAQAIGAPYLVFNKTRHGDREVEMSLPEVSAFKHHTPVLLDDIISSGMTMIEAVQALQANGLPRAVCIGVHALFAENAYERLSASWVQRVVTCNTIKHPSNAIDISSLF